MSAIIEVSGVSKAFGGVKANVDISMQVEKGSITVLLDRTFTVGEQEYADTKNDPTERYAVRWAAKEAVMKAMGVGLGEVQGKVFRIGHLGSLTDVMVLSGLAAIEMAMADLSYPIKLGTGVAAAQDYYRETYSGNARAAA